MGIICSACQPCSYAHRKGSNHCLNFHDCGDICQFKYATVLCMSNILICGYVTGINDKRIVTSYVM